MLHQNIEVEVSSARVQNCYEHPTDCSLNQALSTANSKIRKKLTTANTKIKEKFICLICCISFSSKSNFKRHIVSIHKANPNLNSSDSKNKNKFLCPVCGKSFSSKSSTERHIVSIHKMSSHDLCIKRSLNYKCDMKNKHMTETVPEKILVCPVCHQGIKKTVINEHFIDSHNIKMESQELKFPNIDNFNIWKTEIERNTKSKFVKSATSQNSKDNKAHYFKCHRSGNYQSSGKGLRRLKMCGSNKIDAYCPAAIKLVQSRDGECLAVYRSTHVGHRNDLACLFLTNEERNFVASKIAANASFDCILKEIRNSVSDLAFDRLHLLTRQDLHNIKSSSNLSSSYIKPVNEISRNYESLPDEISSNDNSQPYEINADEDSPPDKSLANNLNPVVLLKKINDTSSLQSPKIHYKERQECLIKKYTKLIQSLSKLEQYEIMEKNLKSLVLKLDYDAATGKI